MWFYNKLVELGYCKLDKPKKESRISDKGKIRYFYRLRTFILVSFYNKEGIKGVPKVIADYLTPQALAIWIMDDGSKENTGLKLSTHSFVKEDVDFLRKVQLDKYGIITSRIQNKPKQYHIYISAKSMPNLTNLVKPFMHPSKYYKLGKYIN